VGVLVGSRVPDFRDVNHCVMALNGADLEIALFTVCGGQGGIAVAESASTKSTTAAREKHHEVGS